MKIIWAGSLIKLVYFSRHQDQSSDDKTKRNVKNRLGFPNGNRRSYPILGGRLHFVKFETSKINDCLDFIYSKQLHCGGSTLFSITLDFYNSTGCFEFEYHFIILLFLVFNSTTFRTWLNSRLWTFSCLQEGNHVILMLWLIQMP